MTATAGLLACFVLGVSAPALGAAAAAAQPSPPCPEGSPRALGDTVFIPLLSVKWPFVLTQVGSTTRGGGLGFVRRESDPFSEGMGGAVDTVYFGETLELQVALWRWVALELGFQGEAIVPVGTDSFFALGTVAWWSARVGAVAQLLRARRVQLSIGLEGRAYRARAVVPRRLLETLAITTEGGIDFDRDSLVTSFQGAGLAPSLRFAWAPFTGFGVQASVDYDFLWVDHELGEGFDLHDLNWAVGVQYGLHGLGAPFAIPAAYRMRIDLNDDRGLIHQVESGVYYTGRDHLSLGANFTAAFRGDAANYVGAVRLFYFW